MAHTIFENHVELGFPEENLHKVKDLKINTKKSLIRSTAEIDIIEVDIMAKMWEDSPARWLKFVQIHPFKLFPGLIWKAF